MAAASLKQRPGLNNPQAAIIGVFTVIAMVFASLVFWGFHWALDAARFQAMTTSMPLWIMLGATTLPLGLLLAVVNKVSALDELQVPPRRREEFDRTIHQVVGAAFGLLLYLALASLGTLLMILGNAPILASASTVLAWALTHALMTLLVLLWSMRQWAAVGVLRNRMRTAAEQEAVRQEQLRRLRSSE